MVELKGSLSGIGLPAIIQLIGDLHHSGRLELMGAAVPAELGFDDGRLVAATFGDERGQAALAACSRELANAEFRFVEGPHTGERTIDVGAAQLQSYLSRLKDGEAVDEPVAQVPSPPQTNVAPGACMFLGFADDAARHYSRPTALHRCFSRGAASLVTGQDQRELCLSGRYASCGRFQTASAARPAGGQMPPGPAAPPPPISPQRPNPPGVPAGVTARMNAVAQMHLAQEASSPPELGGSAGGDSVRPRSAPAQNDRSPRRRPASLLIAIGAVLGLLILAGVLTLVVPTLEGTLAQRQPNPGAQAFEPVPTLARPPSVAPRPSDASTTATRAPDVTITTTARPALVASPALISNTATGSPSPVQSVVPVATPQPTPALAVQPLMDVLFSAGPAAGWLDNPPFAGWSDGAYRLQARQIGQFIAVGAPIDRPLADVVVSATFRKTGGPPGGGYGLIIRDQGARQLDGVSQNLNAYVLETGDRGEFGVWRRDGDHWIDLVPWSKSTSVRAGGSPNDLTVHALATVMTFMINGTEVARLEDGTLSSGGIGVFVGGDNNEVALDRFAVEIPN